MRRSLSLLVFAFLALVAYIPATLGSPGSGSLDFGSAPVLDGTLSAEGAGELRFFDGADLLVEGSGARLVLARTWFEETHVKNPIGDGPVVADPGDTQHSEQQFQGASFRLDTRAPGFVGLAYTEDDGSVAVAQHDVAEWALAAFESPELVVDGGVVDGQAREGEDHVFTFASSGARFPVDGDSFALTGAFTFYFWNATFIVTGADGTEQTFASGIRTVSETPTTAQVVHEYYLLHVTDGTASVSGGDAAAWLADPVVEFDGTMKANPATGRMVVAGETHELDAAPVTMEGLLTLVPKPMGEPVAAEEEDAYHVSTAAPSGGVYPGASASLAGDVTLLSVGPGIPSVEASDLAVIASAGVVTLAGALFFFTPQGKWIIGAMLAPLYAKTAKDRLLDNESRERIYHAICNNPGINLSQIHRIAELGWGVTVYHLKMMEKNGLIFSESGARDKCFFENEPRYRQLRAAIAALANKEPVQRVASAVKAEPGLTQSDVISATGLSQRAVSYYLNRLAKVGLVSPKREGSFVRYDPQPQLVEALRLVVGVDGSEPEQGAVTVGEPAPAFSA